MKIFKKRKMLSCVTVTLSVLFILGGWLSGSTLSFNEGAESGVSLTTESEDMLKQHENSAIPHNGAKAEAQSLCYGISPITAYAPAVSPVDMDTFETFSNEEPLPHEHVWGEWTLTEEPTCSVPGTEDRFCEACGHSESREVPTTGHSYGEWSVTAEPTCSVPGTEDRFCEACGHSESREVPKSGHSYGEWSVTEEPTCTVPGTEDRFCEACGHSESREVPKSGHSYGEWSVTEEPTCSVPGTEDRFCEACGHSESREVPKSGHSYGEWSVTEEPTCTTHGKESRFCDVCGSGESREVPKAGHSYDEWMITEDATCMDEGKQIRYCVHCGSFETSSVPTTDHSYDEWTDMRMPTCTDDGALIHFCIYCGNFETMPVPAEGHTEEISPERGSTCVETGLAQGKHCSICYEILTPQEVTPALGHDFSPEWTVDIEPTTTTVGQKSRHCSRCDEVTDVIEIAKLVEIIDTSKKFTDVTDSWSKAGIDYVVSYGYMNGTGNGSTFSPSGTMTRAMIVSVLHRIADKPAPAVNNPFTDLEAGQTWYHEAVIWAYENGIVTGTSATTFAPTGAVTREQMATFLYRFAKYMDHDTSKSADLTVFPDASKVGSWAYDALAWANAEGLITGAKGNDGTTRLDPQGQATREQVATILMRFCESFNVNE